MAEQEKADASAEMRQPVPSTSVSVTPLAAEMTQPVPSTSVSVTPLAAEMTQPVPSTSVSVTPLAAEMTQPVPSTSVSGSTSISRIVSASETPQDKLEAVPKPSEKRVAGEDEGYQGKKKRRTAYRKEGNLLMSEEDEELLRKQRVNLRENISLEDGHVLAYLRSWGVMTESEEEDIKESGPNASQVVRLLNLLRKCDCTAVDKLIHSLEEAGQSNVAKQWLRPARHPNNWNQLEDTEEADHSCSNVLSKTDKRMLESARPRLMQDLDLRDGNVLGLLRSQEVITPSEETLIQTLQAGKGVGQLVNYLLRKPPGSLELFLHILKMSCNSSVLGYLRQPTGEPPMMKPRPNLQTGQSYPDLQEVLKSNTQERLDEWKAALEGQLPYINQPCRPTFKNKASKQQLMLNSTELIENSLPGDRLVIYGEAGMGKTTLLKHLARSWIERSNKKLVDKFDYVFLIPLRLVGNISLLNIICDELKLIPLSSLRDLEKELDKHQRKALFLLDSYEELRGDVVKARYTAIDDLITGRLFQKSTVVITSRPGSQLKQSEDQTTAQLQDLPENEVYEIIQQHFGENEDAVDKVQRSFPAMAYLQKPINLALFIFIITNNKHLTLSYTQAELFSLVLQYIMLAFAKKKKLKEFTPQPDSYITNKDIPRDIRRLFRDIAKKCYQHRKENNVKIHIEDADDLQEYLDFGLFTAGIDRNTVLLPHRLFIEYFTAAHVAENPKVWKTLFKKIKMKSECQSPSLPLPDVVRSMGLENVLRFVIALSPQPQLGQVCRQVGTLFVLQRRKIVLDIDNVECDNYQVVNFEYFSELIRDCGVESGKRLLARALVNARVRDVTENRKSVTSCCINSVEVTDWEEDISHVLFQYLDYKQCVTFVKKIHNIDLSVIDGKTTLSCTGGNGRLGIILENVVFVLTLVYRHDCLIAADELYIRGAKCRLHLPASVLTRMSAVRQLRLRYCELCQGLPDSSPTVLHSSPCPTYNSLEIGQVELDEVEGLEHCDVITSRQCQLKMKMCGDLRVSTIKTCFPRVSELELYNRTPVVYETEEELTSWLSTVPTVRVLILAPQHEGGSVSLSHLLNILAEKDLKYLELWRSTLLLAVRDTSDTVKQNNTLSGLRLNDCKGGVDLGQLLEVCSRQCPQLKEVWVDNSNLVFDDEKVESVKQLPGLQKFWLSKSAVHTPAGQRLSQQEAEQLLHRLCPSAEIDVWDYPEPECASESDSESDSEPDSESESEPDSESESESEPDSESESEPDSESESEPDSESESESEPDSESESEPDSESESGTDD